MHWDISWKKNLYCSENVYWIVTYMYLHDKGKIFLLIFSPMHVVLSLTFLEYLRINKWDIKYLNAYAVLTTTTSEKFKNCIFKFYFVLLLYLLHFAYKTGNDMNFKCWKWLPHYLLNYTVHVKCLSRKTISK